MAKVDKYVANENGEAGSFLTPHPILSLTGNIFEETEIALHHISKRVKKLFHFAGAAVTGQYDHEEENDRKADTQQNAADRQRQWQLRKLRHINLQLYHQIGDLLKIKLQVLDAIERLKMAELEKSVKDDLVKRHTNNVAQLKTAERRSRDVDDWVPADYDDEEQNDGSTAGHTAARSADTDVDKSHSGKIRKLRKDEI